MGTRIIEQIREVELSSFDGQVFKVTMTLGVSTSEEATDFNETVRRADDRLYVGKRAGKNTIVSEE